MEKVVGGGAVALKTVLRLPYFNTAVEDGQVEVAYLYIKPLPGERAFAYGACRATLLFSWLDANRQRFFGTESAELPFCEELECRAAPAEALRASFTPVLRCERESAVSYLWKVTAEGQLSLLAGAEPPQDAPEVPPQDAPETPPQDAEDAISAAGSAGGGVTVLRLRDLGIPAGQLLDMDRATLRGLLGGRQGGREQAVTAAPEEAPAAPAPPAENAGAKAPSAPAKPRRPRRAKQAKQPECAPGTAAGQGEESR